MQLKIAFSSLALLASTASAIGINLFGAEDCGSYTHTVSNPGRGVCAAVNPGGNSWEIVNSSGCTVHVFRDEGCGTEMTPAQSTANKCYDAPTQVKGVKFDC